MKRACDNAVLSTQYSALSSVASNPNTRLSFIIASLYSPSLLSQTSSSDPNRPILIVRPSSSLRHHYSFPSIVPARLKDGVKDREFPEYLREFERQNALFVDIRNSHQEMVEKSYQNRRECELVVELCAGLVRSARSTGELNVGVITPYKSQVRLLNKSLRSAGVRELIQVNTVDSFQGQEKDVIILSTVRASHNPGNDASLRDRLIGFVSDERRMNVALTRARFVLIVVGNSATLSVDLNWNRFIEFLAERDGYFNCHEGSALFAHRLLAHRRWHQLSRSYEKKVWAGINRQKQVEEFKIDDFDAKGDDDDAEPPAEPDTHVPLNLNILEHGNGQLDIEFVQQQQLHQQQQLSFMDPSVLHKGLSSLIPGLLRAPELPENDGARESGEDAEQQAEQRRARKPEGLASLLDNYYQNKAPPDARPRHYEPPDASKPARRGVFSP